MNFHKICIIETWMLKLQKRIFLFFLVKSKMLIILSFFFFLVYETFVSLKATEAAAYFCYCFLLLKGITML